MLNRLTDNYSKDPNSNISKLFQIIANEVEEFQLTLNDIKDYRNIDKAIGKALDGLGKNVLEYRNTENDEIYRDYIKIKIISNLSQGDINTINEVAAFLLKDKYIGSEETWNNPMYEDLAGVVIRMFPNYTHIPVALNRVRAGGVKLYFETVMPGDILGLISKYRSSLFNYKLTNRFITEDVKGEVLKCSIPLITKITLNNWEYPLTNEFVGISNSSVKSSRLGLDAKLVKIVNRYPICGEFMVGELM